MFPFLDVDDDGDYDDDDDIDYSEYTYILTVGRYGTKNQTPTEEYGYNGRVFQHFIPLLHLEEKENNQNKCCCSYI